MRDRVKNGDQGLRSAWVTDHMLVDAPPASMHVSVILSEVGHQ